MFSCDALGLVMLFSMYMMDLMAWVKFVSQEVVLALEVGPPVT